MPDGVVDIDAFSSDSKQNRKNKHAKQKKRKIVNKMKTELMKEIFKNKYICIYVYYRNRTK